MTDLTTRIEAAKEPSRALDAEIHSLYSTDRLHPYLEGTAITDMGRPYAIPHYTGSVDAVLKLVPEGWEWTLTEAGHCEMIRDRQRGPIVEGNAAHHSLALLAAILRAERKDDATDHHDL